MSLQGSPSQQTAFSTSMAAFDWNIDNRSGVAARFMHDQVGRGAFNHYSAHLSYAYLVPVNELKGGLRFGLELGTHTRRS